MVEQKEENEEKKEEPVADKIEEVVKRVDLDVQDTKKTCNDISSNLIAIFNTFTTKSLASVLSESTSMILTWQLP